ncbi:hypothetical protein [Micromonospora sp. B9E7]|uniref:hypothetical protein n=1 Tax=Micromonospora sp. B9E7 TaxID=3153574 RepID=UPI00325F1952
MRWGELTGLTRDNVDVTTGSIHVHPDVGALDEVEGKLFLGPPKTNDSVRHTHKTWPIEDGIPEITQARRLGHRLAGVRGIYSHVTEPMITNVVDALHRRWEATQPDRTADTARRLRAVA